MLWMGRRVVQQAQDTPTLCETDIDLVLIPGMKLTQGQPNDDYQKRLKRGQLLFQQHGARLLIMGGITGNEIQSEAHVGKLFLIEQGIPSTALILEDRSRNTLENMFNARNTLSSTQTDNFAMVSNRYHLARCQALANGLGMYPTLCAAEDHFSAPVSIWPRLLLESFYLHWYYTGKIWSRVTKNSHSLSRIS